MMRDMTAAGILIRGIPPLLLLLSCFLSAETRVTKVDPPNWWAGHSINPVRLLIRGQDLAGARIEAGAGGLSASNFRVNERGTYLFADLRIDPAVQPGRYSFKVVTPSGAAEFNFEISSPLPRRGRFQGFSSDDVIYLIMPDRFANGDPGNDDPPSAPGLLDRTKKRFYHGGDLAGIIARLPYLKELGVTALWLNPWYDNSNTLNTKERYDNQDITDYHGYGAVDFYAVDEHLGDLTLLRRLVDEAHRLGIKIIQDQVANHTGPMHPWAADSPTPTWFNGTVEHHLANRWQTWTVMDPHATEELKRETLDGWFINILPDLNQDDAEQRGYWIQNSLWWVGMTGMDGIRQDTMPYVPRDFWRDWTAALRREYPDLRVVGEMLDGNPALVSFLQGGRAAFDGVDTGIEAMFDFPLCFAVRSAFGEGKPLRDVSRMLAHDHLYVNPNLLVTMHGLHDISRFMHLKGATPAGLKLAWTFLMTTRGIPLIYYGDEIAMAGGDDPDNRRDFPGGWAGDPNNAFTREGRSQQNNELWDHLKGLIGLRKANPALRHGRTENILALEQQWVYRRVFRDNSVLIALNNEDKTVTLAVPGFGPLSLGPREGRVVIESRAE